MEAGTDRPASTRRPNTVEPPPERILLTDDDIARMSDEELIRFADEYVGLVIPPGTKRGAILTKIANAAEGAHDGWPQ